MENTKKAVSIVIVNYKTPELLKNCVSSIIESTKDLTYEIIIVDNNSEDESERLIKDILPKVNWINSGYNAGFSRANNIGIRNAVGEYILLLNSDTIVNKNTLINTYNDYVELEKTNQKIGMLSCQLIDLEGNKQHNSRTKISNIQKIIIAHPLMIFLSRIARIKPEDRELTHSKMDSLHTIFHETKWLAGTYLFYNRKISSEQGYFLDEDFFMYGEDIEWSLRLRKKGFKHFFTPNATIIHAEGGSFKIKTPKKVQISISEWLLIMKYYGRFTFLLIAWINLTGLQLDNFFAKRLIRKEGMQANKEDIESFEIRKQVIVLFKKYFFEILFKYKRKTSGSKKYLKTF